MFDDPDLIQYVLVMAAVGIVTSDLAIGVLRGRFGTPQRRALLDLRGMAGAEVPRDALRRSPAQSLGHSSSEHPAIRGMGVLWLERDRLEFLLRRPRYPLSIDLGAIHHVEASTVVHRPGVRPVRSREPLLVVEWWSLSGLSMVSFRVEDAVGWARQIDEARTPGELVLPAEGAVYQVT